MANERSLANLKPFQPGVSGNPSGRPKKRVLSDRYQELLESPLPREIAIAMKLPPGSLWGDAVALTSVRTALRSSEVGVSQRRELREASEGRAATLLNSRRKLGLGSSAGIDTDLIRKFIADQQGRRLSNGSINRSVSALRRMFYLAKEDGKLRDVPTFPMVKESRPRQGLFEREQYEKLFLELRLPAATVLDWIFQRNARR